MANKSKIKGSNFERNIVNQFIEAGVPAKRAYASNGESLGLHCEVDVVTYETAVDATNDQEVSIVDLKIQCKRKKKFPKCFGLNENVDCAVFREDQGQSYVLFRLEDFIERYLS